MLYHLLQNDCTSIAALGKYLKPVVAKKLSGAGHINVDSVVLTEIINTKYKGIDVEIHLFKSQDYITVDGLSTSSPLCKTKSGLGIGSTKLQIIAAYEGYHIDARPVFTYTEGSDKTEKSKTESTITVKEDTEGYAIVFSLLNNKVVSLAIVPIYDDEE